MCLIDAIWNSFHVGNLVEFSMKKVELEIYHVFAKKLVEQGKAYVLYTIASEPATVSIIWGEATLIEMLQNSTDDDQNHYDLGGRRIYKTDKGVHIIRTAEGRLQGKKTIK